MTAAPLRVVSLLPSATDTVLALDYGHVLVGRSHEVRMLTKKLGRPKQLSVTPSLQEGHPDLHGYNSKCSFFCCCSAMRQDCSTCQR
jgi:hypothetical protein